MSEVKTISNWGNYPVVKGSLDDFSDTTQALNLVAKTKNFITRGSGLSYGDASLGEQMISTAKFNKILSFDEANGVVHVQAGATLDDILKRIVPSGWFLPVTPGTKFITAGGAVAGDVHGKNHHSEGSFCEYVTRLEVMLADGTVTHCSATENTQLFRVICGGLGLGALILSVAFRLKKIETSYIHQKNIIVRGLDEMLDRLAEFNNTVYSVSWIDCVARGKNLGRGVLMLGDHAKADEVKAGNKLKVHGDPWLNVPFNFPSFTLNNLSISVFNFGVYHKHRLASKDFIVHYEPFFYPLDKIRHWNRAYGSRGLLQYQFVLPFETSKKGLHTIVRKISDAGSASFLSVLKSMGKGENMISFPIPGFTLAMDFPAAPSVFPLLEELDKIVVDLGGRIYLVKDARMKPEIYWNGYSTATEFREAIHKLDPNHKFSSALSRRLQML
ncbi:MAG TPA: FAD-binding oxidoreductase [Cyclobacteriaceae bacterium]|nr:FAD-binding oxidoreductase [Cyclobacteriaceae bacterium]